MSAIGIDLGTTYSCVAVHRNKRIEIVPNDQGKRLTPSCVSISDTELLTGEAALEEIPFNFENTLFQIKRLIGRNYDDPNVQEDSKLWGFKIINEDNKPKIQVNYNNDSKIFEPEEISAMILKQLKTSAEDYMGEKITDAVITVPAYFNNSQRKATLKAGRIAGLKVLQMINEPTAAAIAYGLDREKHDKRNVLIFDLGGGTFDVTLITIKDRVFDVKATGGDTHMGGEDFNNRLVEHFVEEYRKQTKVDISGNKRAMSRLRVKCESAKKTLSVSMVAKVQIDALYEGNDLKATITRDTFERLNYDYFEQTITTVETTLLNAGFNKKEVDEVVLVGGSTRIPKLRKMIQDFFDGKELYKTINPDEAVAYGAAALAYNLSKYKSEKVKEFILHDIVPLPLGINVHGDIMSVVVKKNSKIPSKHYTSVTTVADNQTQLKFSVYQGERAASMHNKHLGSFVLSGILPAPRRVPSIDVCFDIDPSGVLKVTATDEITGNKKKLRLGADTIKLTLDEIDFMVREGEKFRMEDIEHKNVAQLRIRLETLVYNTEESVISLECQGKLAKQEKDVLLEKCRAVYEWLRLNKKAPKKSIMDKQIEFQNCSYPIFRRICGAEKDLNKTKKDFEDNITSVEREIQDIWPSGLKNEKRYIERECYYAREFLILNKNATIEEIKKSYNAFASEVYPILEILKDGNLEDLNETKKELEDHVGWVEREMHACSSSLRNEKRFLERVCYDIRQFLILNEVGEYLQ
uniref:heat shock 70 kDa protein-like n=1 Tax=Styela clava TaxID=7725 RepID=UPI0019397AC3|nr:heat shock 70 kDa protein-like [Styela clava]